VIRPKHHQFDFWIGDWQVHRPDGALAGINRITREYGGCVIHERYATGKGYSGESLNVYDAARKVWHQTWVDDSGLLLTIEGRWNGKSMVLEGLRTGLERRHGEATHHLDAELGRQRTATLGNRGCQGRMDRGFRRQVHEELSNENCCLRRKKFCGDGLRGICYRGGQRIHQR
jgi:hypothetical protein